MFKTYWTTNSITSNYSTHLIVNTIRRTYVSNLEINKHVFPISITESREVRFSIQFLQMFHCRFANAGRVFVLKISSTEVGEHEKRTKEHPQQGGIFMFVLHWKFGVMVGKDSDCALLCPIVAASLKRKVCFIMHSMFFNHWRVIIVFNLKIILYFPFMIYRIFKGCV